MFGINGFEMVILVIVALFVIGPQRLPEYAGKLRDFVRSFRRMAEGAKETVKQDFGADLDAYDWRSLDPRQYDPRRIVREALAEEDRAIREERLRGGSSNTSGSGTNSTDGGTSPGNGSTSDSGSSPGSSASSHGSSTSSNAANAAGAGGGAGSGAESTATPLERHRSQVQQRVEGSTAPFDPEAT